MSRILRYGLGSLLVFSSIYLSGCAGTPDKEEWLMIVPTQRYTFTDVKGVVRGDKMAVSGTLRKRGILQKTFVDVSVVGKDKEGNVVVKETHAVRVEQRDERFTFRTPYQEGLDWAITTEEAIGFMDRIIRKAVK